METFLGGETEKLTYCKEKTTDTPKGVSSLMCGCQGWFHRATNRRRLDDPEPEGQSSEPRRQALTSLVAYRNIARRRGGGLAQWKSTCLTRRGSWVQIPHLPPCVALETQQQGSSK